MSSPKDTRSLFESLSENPTPLDELATADTFITTERRRAVTHLIAKVYPSLFVSSVWEGNNDRQTDETTVHLSFPKPVPSHRGTRHVFMATGLTITVNVDGHFVGEPTPESEGA